MATVNIDYGKMMAQTTVVVKIKGFNKVWKIRTFIAVRFLNIGAWLLGTKLEIRTEYGNTQTNN